MDKYLEEMPSQKSDNLRNHLENVDDENFSPQNILVDTHQALTADPLKSLTNHFEIAASVGDVRESRVESPFRTRRSVCSSKIYELLWPEPKCVIELGHITPPFPIGSELLISIIQVSTYFLSKTFSPTHFFTV